MDLPVKLLEKAVSKFIHFKTVVFYGTYGSVNNIVRKIETDEGNSFILRVYNNGGNNEKVEFEHKVLATLKDVPMSYQVPDAMLSIPILDNQGCVIESSTTHVPITDDNDQVYYASLFHLIPGVPPKLTCVLEIGKACGELTQSFSKITIDCPPPTQPYYNLYKAHHSITREAFFTHMNSSHFDAFRESADFMVTEIIALESLIEELLEKDLPQQYIHGDLQYDNVLVDTETNKVTGVLDFEFVALDWRAMDIAITLSKYAGEISVNPLEYFTLIAQSYSKFIQLSPVEMKAVPDLIILRILSNVIYFVGRALAGEDKLSTLTNRIDVYVQRVKWLKANREAIVKCFIDVN